MKMRKINLFVIQLFFLFVFNISAQSTDQPKLVVGIVVDQMRFTDLYRYQQFFSDNGFKKLISNGSNFVNAHYNYIPTNTGPGHASIYTGTTPYFHGIINNDFYDRLTKRFVNCVQDDEMQTIGSNGDEGKKSPKNLFATTITDALKLFTNQKSKVISISIKDRGAILPAGHLADGVFWYNTKNGEFISSSYYLNDLPQWVKEFNKKNIAEKFLSSDWNLLLDAKAYEINSPDESEFEPDFFNEGKKSFPHSFKNLKQEEKFEKLSFTPFVHDMLIELAKSAIINEQLGKNSVPDFLAISFSSTDLIGHMWGNYSYELMDTYLRLDRQIGELINFLDKEIGKGNYLLFLTSDHGAIETPGYLKKNKIPTGEIGTSKVSDSLKAFAKRKFGSESLIENYSSGSIYFNRAFIEQNNLDYKKVEEEFSIYLRNTFPEIQKIGKRSFLENQSPSRESSDLILNGWNPIKSADILFTLRPGYLYRFMERGTTHGSSYTYDTHIPLIFYGWKIPKQTVNDRVYIIDIAPTISTLLKITQPNSSFGIALIK